MSNTQENFWMPAVPNEWVELPFPKKTESSYRSNLKAVFQVNAILVGGYTMLLLFCCWLMK